MPLGPGNNFMIVNIKEWNSKMVVTGWLALIDDEDVVVQSAQNSVAFPVLP